MKKAIQKNLYDLEFNELLNKQNTIIIIIATFVAGFLLGNFPSLSKLIILVFGINAYIGVKYHFDKKLRAVREKISDL